MKSYMWLSACLALATAALVAGCGGSSSTGSAARTTSGATTAPPGPASTTSTRVDGGTTPDDVYHACLDALQGIASERVAQRGCAQARDAFVQCVTQASNAPEGAPRDAALKACQRAADKAVAQLRSSP